MVQWVLALRATVDMNVLSDKLVNQRRVGSVIWVQTIRILKSGMSLNMVLCTMQSENRWAWRMSNGIPGRNTSPVQPAPPVI
jgi:hypothetical protein